MSDTGIVPIYGAAAPGDEQTLSIGGVPSAAVVANMEQAMRSVGELAAAAKKALKEVDIEFFEVQLALGIDGSVGLLSTKASLSAQGTFTVRVKL